MVIHILVGGRFHSERMANAFAGEGHEVHLFTSLPRSRFRTSASVIIHSFPICESFRLLGKWFGNENLGDHLKIAAFGFLVREFIRLRQMKADIFIGWSSFSLEVLSHKHAERQFVIRDSSHIEAQMKVLGPEYQKLRIAFPDRSWVEAREILEYSLADEVIVLSEYAAQTFRKRGINHLRILRLGVETQIFSRRMQTQSHAPLRVVNFGSLSVRKGIHYLLEALSDYPPDVVSLHLIGSVEPGFEKVLERYPSVTVIPAMKQAALGAYLQGMDLFVLPSLEDGFGQTLIQAMAVGLPVITTDQCGASEFVTSGLNGIVVPACDVAQLKQAIDRMIHSPEERARLGAAAAASVVDVGWSGYEATLKHWAREWEKEQRIKSGWGMGQPMMSE